MNPNAVMATASMLTNAARITAAARIAAQLKNETMSFPDFIPEAWKIIEPGREYLRNWSSDFLAEHLEAVTLGQITRLVINIPPRNMKSILASVCWPAHAWSVTPGKRFIFASYSQSLSTKHSLDRRAIIESDWYKERWGGLVTMAPDQNQKTEFQNLARGVMVATSIGGTVTGKGGDIIVVDDGINPLEAESKPQREKALRFVKQSLTTRLDDKKTGAIVIIEQRLHREDITGDYCLKEAGFTHIRIPAIAEERQVLIFPMSQKKKVREIGDVLWPEREGKAELDKQKATMGSRAFTAQYQQDPTSDEGNMWRRGWWKFWREPPAGLEVIVQSWDLSFKGSDDSSYVVGEVWGKRGSEYFLLDQVRDHLDFPATLGAIRSLTAKWPHAVTKWVEDKANGPAVIATLQKEIPGLIPIKPEGTKEARAFAVQPLMEAGNVYLPDPSIAPWVHDYIEECAAFPFGANDDQVDTTSQALLRLQFHGHVDDEDVDGQDVFGLNAEDDGIV